MNETCAGLRQDFRNPFSGFAEPPVETHRGTPARPPSPVGGGRVSVSVRRNPVRLPQETPARDFRNPPAATREDGEPQGSRRPPTPRTPDNREASRIPGAWRRSSRQRPAGKREAHL